MMTQEDRAALREAASKAQAGDGVMVHAWTGAGHTLQMITTTNEGTAAVLALLDECERLREALAYYADTFCELDKGHECCGKLDEDECSGCKARATMGDGA